MISVIMPVYNSETFVANAIKSVLNQTFKDFELILVNDGSTDSSGEICDEFERRDKRIKVIHQRNRGISIARNVGLNVALGNYIAFIDNDDLFDKYLLEDNYKLAMKYNADIVSFGVGNFEDENHMTSFDVDEQIVTYYDKKLIVDNYFNIRTLHLANIWNKLFKKENIINNKIIFQESFKYGYEDYIFNVENILVANNFIANSKRYYIHFARLGHSTSLKYDFNRVESLYKGFKIEMEGCNRLNMNPYTLAGINAFYIKICARELYGKDKLLSNREKATNLKKFETNIEDIKFNSIVKYIYNIDKIAAIQWVLFKKNLYLIMQLLVKVLKIRARLFKKFF